MFQEQEKWWCRNVYFSWTMQLRYAHTKNLSSNGVEVTCRCRSKCGDVCFVTKAVLSVAASSRRIYQIFSNNVVSEVTARQWRQKFRSGDISLWGERRSGWPNFLGEEGLKATIDGVSPKICVELAERFQVNLPALHKAVYEFRKWVPHIVSNANKQHLTFLGTTTFPYLVEFSLVTKSGPWKALKIVTWNLWLKTTSTPKEDHDLYLVD